MDYDELVRRGIAVGQSDIATDSINFVFGEERYSIPTYYALGKDCLAMHNGYFYEAKIDRLRALSVKLQGAGNG